MKVIKIAVDMASVRRRAEVESAYHYKRTVGGSTFSDNVLEEADGEIFEILWKRAAAQLQRVAGARLRDMKLTMKGLEIYVSAADDDERNLTGLLQGEAEAFMAESITDLWLGRSSDTVNLLSTLQSCAPKSEEEKKARCTRRPLPPF